MNIIVDLIILGIVALCVFLGYKKGLVGVVLKILSFLIAIVISFILFKPVSLLVINYTPLDEKIETYIYQTIAGESIENTDPNVEMQLDVSNVPQFMANNITNIVEKASDDAKINVAQLVSNSLAVNIVQLIVLLSLFAISRILLLLVKTASDKLTELPIIKQFDKTGGIIYGLLQGLLVVFVVLAIISFIQIPILLSFVQSSFVGSILFNNNILLMIFF